MFSNGDCCDNLVIMMMVSSKVNFYFMVKIEVKKNNMVIDRIIIFYILVMVRCFYNNI